MGLPPTQCRNLNWTAGRSLISFFLCPTEQNIIIAYLPHCFSSLDSVYSFYISIPDTLYDAQLSTSAHNKFLWIQQVRNYTLDQHEMVKKDYFSRRKQQQPIPLPTSPLQKNKREISEFQTSNSDQTCLEKLVMKTAAEIGKVLWFG